MICRIAWPPLEKIKNSILQHFSANSDDFWKIVLILIYFLIIFLSLASTHLLIGYFCRQNSELLTLMVIPAKFLKWTSGSVFLLAELIYFEYFSKNICSQVNPVPTSLNELCEQEAGWSSNWSIYVLSFTIKAVIFALHIEKLKIFQRYYFQRHEEVCTIFSFQKNRKKNCSYSKMQRVWQWLRDKKTKTMRRWRSSQLSRRQQGSTNNGDIGEHLKKKSISKFPKLKI